MSDPVLKKCHDCGLDFKGAKEYNVALHYGFKHDDWSFLDRWYAKKGVPPRNRVHARLPLKDLLKPRFFERLWKCACCNEPLIYDRLKKTMRCRCKTLYDYEIPKDLLDRHFRPYPALLEASQ